MNPPRLLARLLRGSLAPLLALATVVAPTTGWAEPRDRVVNIAMEDQFRSRHETGALRGDVVVLVYSERHGAERALELGRRLHVHFHPTAEKAPESEWARQPVKGLPGWPAGVRVPDVHVIPVACMPEVPRALQPVARSRMRTDSPTVAVWLDFEDEMNRLFGMAVGEPNVAIIDTVGRVHAVQTGHVDELEFRELAVTIDHLRLASRSEVRQAGATAPLRR
jgi:hypothetical protein